MALKSPADLALGEYIRQQVVPAGMSVKEAASRLGVGRPALSNLLNGNAALSPDTAVRLEKSFGADRQKLIDMQAVADRARQRETEKAVAVRRYVPNFLSIKARQIEAWTEDHLDARQLLPVLLRRLVHSTGHDLRQVDFPDYDNAERKGSDGIIESDAPTAWIPDGKSFWEFGVNKNPQVKAEKDYAARVASVPAAERAQSTLVFVTPRNWPGKVAWLRQKNALNEWRAVRILDASDLEQWLEESIPPQIWLAEKIGIVTTDEAERELVTVYRNHHSIVVRPRNAVDSEPDISLDLLRHDAFEKAPATMKITGDAVEHLARESGMSPTILRRRLSRVDAIRSPLWAKDSDTARALIPMMLIGAWSAKAKADSEILSVLANRPYEQIEEAVTRLLQFDDPPVWSAGSYRGVASSSKLGALSESASMCPNPSEGWPELAVLAIRASAITGHF